MEKSRIIDGRTIAAGDVVLGLASSGAHSNGYSLVRKILERSRPDLSADFHGGTLGDAIMAPTRIYVKPLLALIQSLTAKGMAHITGGGLTENIPRILPDDLTATLAQRNWPLPPLFQWLQREGQVADEEMHRVFNCGIGMAVVVAAEDERHAVELLQSAGETVFSIGRIESRTAGAAQTTVS